MRILLFFVTIGLFSIPLHSQKTEKEDPALLASIPMIEAVLPVPAPAPAEAEQALELEEWMLRPFTRKDLTLAECIKVTEEPPLRLEEWMYCCADWNIEVKVPGRSPGNIDWSRIYLALP